MRKFVPLFAMCGLAFVTAIAATAQQRQDQQNPNQAKTQDRDQARTSGDPKTEAMWKQIHQVHNQIIAMEVAEAKGGAGRAQSSPTTQTPARTPAAGQGDENQLLAQLAQIHKQLVAAKVAEVGGSSRQAPGAAAGKAQDAARDKDKDVGRTADRGQGDQLWTRYTEIQKQLFDQAIAKAAGGERTTTFRPDIDAAKDRPANPPTPGKAAPDPVPRTPNP